MSKQAADGMVHLSNLQVVHRDVALRNLLVKQTDKGYVVKISDFGLSRSVESTFYTAAEEGEIPIKWSAPEVLEYGTHSTKSDVYSFGVLLWELFSHGSPPYNEVTNEKARQLILNAAVLSAPRDCPPEMYNVMLKCWEKDSNKRPTFQEIQTAITKFWNSSKGNSVSRVMASVQYAKTPTIIPLDGVSKFSNSCRSQKLHWCQAPI